MLAAVLPVCAGCTWMARLGTSDEGHEHGKTWFVGGAGSIGQVVGTMDVPRGLRGAGYDGAIEVFSWQALIGDAIRDQTDRGRNEAQARRLTRDICKYMDSHPGRPVNLIALSAGTGVATWAIENLPPRYRLARVVFLGSSLSSTYDLTHVLEHVDGQLCNFYSPSDPVLAVFVPMTGSVDRSFWTGAAGLKGFALPTPPAATKPAEKTTAAANPSTSAKTAPSSGAKTAAPPSTGAESTPSPSGGVKPAPVPPSGSATPAAQPAPELPFATIAAYRLRVRNFPYQSNYSMWGYYGGHTDSVAEGFIQHVVAPLLMQPLSAPEELHPEIPPRPDAPPRSEISSRSETPSNSDASSHSDPMHP